MRAHISFTFGMSLGPGAWFWGYKYIQLLQKFQYVYFYYSVFLYLRN